MLFDDVVELFSITDALITLKIPSTNQITGNKTGAREYVELFERGRETPKNSFFIIAPELHIRNIFTEL